MTTWDDGVMLRTLAGEARGEPNDGRRAVAHVMLNRQRSGRWGHSLAEVCFARKQFSCWLQTDPNYKFMCGMSDFDPILLEMAAVLSAARQEVDFTHGATHYYAPAGMVGGKAPPWVVGAKLQGKWGHQLFWSGVA